MKESIVRKLEGIVGPESVRTSREDCIAHSYDATLYQSLPEVVVWPTRTEQVASIMKLANEELIPVTPRGCGTGLSGGSVPMRGGIVLVMTRMNQIKLVDPENLMAVVEPGLINMTLDTTVEKMGLFYPPDPASKKACTMGGNVAEGAGGPRAFKYGCTRRYVLGLEAVLPTGEVIHTGSKCVKYVTGYDMTGMLTASEGTLGIITEITVNLLPLPEHTETMLAVYADLYDAGRTVSEIIAAGVIPSTLEIMDKVTVQTVEQFHHVGLPMDAAAVLLIETDGMKEAALRDAEKVVALCKQCNATRVSKATTQAERDNLWSARRAALAAITRIKPSLVQEDTVVPRSKVADMAMATVEIGRKYNLVTCSYGHAGDGNLHPSILTDVRDKDEMSRVDDAVKAIFEAALELGGTLSGEHGIGCAKAPYLRMEAGDVGIAAMKALKRTFDPNNVLNPGKIFVD